MQKNRWFVHRAALLMVLSLVLLSEAWLSAQSTPPPATGKGPAAVTGFSPTNEVEFAPKKRRPAQEWV